jgi:hypothetical protein
MNYLLPLLFIVAGCPDLASSDLLPSNKY